MTSYTSCTQGNFILISHTISGYTRIHPVLRATLYWYLTQSVDTLLYISCTQGNFILISHTISGYTLIHPVLRTTLYWYLTQSVDTLVYILYSGQLYIDISHNQWIHSYTSCTQGNFILISHTISGYTRIHPVLRATFLWHITYNICLWQATFCCGGHLGF
jgi:putative N-acetylmannosamine-6-phosphate epimerase